VALALGAGEGRIVFCHEPWHCQSPLPQSPVLHTPLAKPQNEPAAKYGALLPAAATQTEFSSGLTAELHAPFVPVPLLQSITHLPP
jgi:hypothetical protein